MMKPALLLIFLSTCTTLTTSSTALRVELKHLDGNANFTLAERLHRVSTPIPRQLELVSGVTVPVISEDWYIAEFSIGNPPQVVQAILSTVSDLVWTQCSTCRPKCFGQSLDYYDYNKSSTAQPVPCDDTLCAAGYGTKPCVGDHDNNDRACHVQDFGATGILRTDEFTFGPAKLNVTFGCMRQDPRSQDLGGPSGLMGLGRGALSLVSQVGSNRFSYCFTNISDNFNSSPLFVGSSAGLSGDEPVITTPFTVNPHGELWSSAYFLSMSGMSVGDTLLDIPRMAFDGGVVINSVTPGTYLPEVAYMALKKEMSRKLGSSLVPSPVESVELCVARGDVGRVIPPLVLHFGGGDLAVPAENYWAPVDLETSCIMVTSMGRQDAHPWDQMAMIGTYMQQNVHILYDLESENISFQPEDCSSI